MNMHQIRLDLLQSIRELEKLAYHQHYYCDDCFYSCPLAIDGCCNDAFDDNKCNCGANKHNEEVRSTIQRITSLIGFI